MTIAETALLAAANMSANKTDRSVIESASKFRDWLEVEEASKKRIISVPPGPISLAHQVECPDILKGPSGVWMVMKRGNKVYAKEDLSLKAGMIVSITEKFDNREAVYDVIIVRPSWGGLHEYEIRLHGAAPCLPAEPPAKFLNALIRLNNSIYPVRKIGPTFFVHRGLHVGIGDTFYYEAPLDSAHRNGNYRVTSRTTALTDIPMNKFTAEPTC